MNGRGVSALSTAIRSRARSAAAAGVLSAVVIADVADGRRGSVLGLAVASPLVAAAMLSPAATASYSLVALAAVTLVGLYNHAYTATVLADQVERLIGIAGIGGLAVAVARARQEREQRLRSITTVAEAVQDALIARPPSTLGPLRVAYSYRAAVRDSRVGGDFADARMTAWGVRLLVGDVRGQGLGTLHLLAAIVGSFRERATERPDLYELLDDLDRAAVRAAGSDEDFATALVAEVSSDGRAVSVALAGHHPPLLLRGGSGRYLGGGPPGLPLGAGLGKVAGTAVRYDLQPGDRILLYTDGIIDAGPPVRGEFPLVSLAPAAMETRPLPDALAALQAAVDDWSGDRHDDAALLAVEVDASLLETEVS